MESIERYTLGKAERLKSRKLTEQLFKEGKSVSFFPVKIIYQVCDASSEKGPFLQAGFTASSRNFKKATDRNRIKRLMREAYRLQKHPLMQRQQELGKSISFFIVYTGKELPSYALVFEKTGLALQRLIQIQRDPK